MSEENKKHEIIKTSSDNEYILFKSEDKRYFFIDANDDDPQPLCTPTGEILNTGYLILAEKIFEDIQLYGTECMSSESILPWHYTMVDNFARMEHKEIEDILDECFLQKGDWTYTHSDDANWTSIFGTHFERVVEIRGWLTKCTHMQMTAACCIGNAYESINIAFVLATLMENYKGDDLQKQFRQLAKLVSSDFGFGRVSDIMPVFDNFKLYYGIHLEEEGSIVNNPSFGFASGISEETEEIRIQFLNLAEEIIEDEGMELPDIHEFLDTERLCKDIISYCNEHYPDSSKKTQEYFVSSYYAAICLAIHHMKNKDAFTKDNAYPFLQSQCDTEFCDVYSDRLLGYKSGNSDSDNIWEIFQPYLKEVGNFVHEQEELTDDVLQATMEPAFVIGVAAAGEYYELSEDSVSDYAGERIEVATLIGRNYYHYTNGTMDKEQPFKLQTDGIELCEEDDDDDIDEEHDFSIASLSAFIPKDCWIKRISAFEDEHEANRLVVIELDGNFDIINVSEILEGVQRVGNGMFMIPGMEMPSKRHYEIQDYLSDEAEEEMELLLSKRYIPDGFAFVGKKLPKEIIDEGGNGGDDTNYTYAQQSAYRMAYMHMSIDTTEEGVIEALEYSTYQSTGSEYWDMFSRPQSIDDRHEELIDMLLYIIDKYSDEEYREL